MINLGGWLTSRGGFSSFCSSREIRYERNGADVDVLGARTGEKVNEGLWQNLIWIGIFILLITLTQVAVI